MRACAARRSTPAEALAEAVARAWPTSRPRAVVAAGPDSRLLRAVLEPSARSRSWPGRVPALPGWAGSLDLVVVLAPEGADPGTAAGGRRGRPPRLPARRGRARGARWSPSTPPGRYATLLPTQTGDQLAIAVVMLDLPRPGRPRARTPTPRWSPTRSTTWPSRCCPHRDLAVNPAKILAIGSPTPARSLWGGTVLAARAARRVAESIRRASGRAALAADAEHLLPVLEAHRRATSSPTPSPTVAASGARRLLVLDDGTADPVVREHPGAG